MNINNFVHNGVLFYRVGIRSFGLYKASDDAEATLSENGESAWFS